MKYVYLINRFNLKGRTEEIIGKLREVSAQFGRESEIVVCDTPAQASAAAAGCGGERCVVTAIGGDGTINVLLNSLIGTGHVLSFIPIGTGNDFYRYCCENMTDGIHKTDIVRINDRYFINAACFGIDADIANDDRFIHNSLIPRRLRYHAGVLYHFLTYRKGRTLRIECEGERITRECTTVVAANARYYGGGYRISPAGRVDDGLMEVYIVDKLGKIRTARMILSMKNAGHLHDPALRMIRTRKLVLSADEPFEANIDGESLRSDRFELEVIPEGICLDFNRAFCERISH